MPKGIPNKPTKLVLSQSQLNQAVFVFLQAVANLPGVVMETSAKRARVEPQKDGTYLVSLASARGRG